MEILKNNSLKEKIKEVVLDDNTNLNDINKTVDIGDAFTINTDKFTASNKRCLRYGNIIQILIQGKLLEAATAGVKIATSSIDFPYQQWGVSRVTSSPTWFGTWIQSGDDTIWIEPPSGGSIPADTLIQVEFTVIL